MGTNSQIEREYDYEEANYYDFSKLNYYEPNAFNQPNNCPNGYYI